LPRPGPRVRPTSYGVFSKCASPVLRARVLSRIASKVDQSVWEDAIDTLLGCAAEGEIAEGFIIAVEKCGRVLAEHFPPEPGSEDELPDRIYLI